MTKATDTTCERKNILSEHILWLSSVYSRNKENNQHVQDKS
jgi:hypothetical protein